MHNISSDNEQIYWNQWIQSSENQTFPNQYIITLPQDKVWESFPENKVMTTPFPCQDTPPPNPNVLTPFSSKSLRTPFLEGMKTL